MTVTNLAAQIELLDGRIITATDRLIKVNVREGRPATSASDQVGVCDIGLRPDAGFISEPGDGGTYITTDIEGGLLTLVADRGSATHTWWQGIVVKVALTRFTLSEEMGVLITATDRIGSVKNAGSLSNASGRELIRVSDNDLPSSGSVAIRGMMANDIDIHAVTDDGVLVWDKDSLSRLTTKDWDLHTDSDAPHSIATDSRNSIWVGNEGTGTNKRMVGYSTAPSFSYESLSAIFSRGTDGGHLSGDNARDLTSSPSHIGFDERTGGVSIPLFMDENYIYAVEGGSEVNHTPVPAAIRTPDLGNAWIRVAFNNEETADYDVGSLVGFVAPNGLTHQPTPSGFYQGYPTTKGIVLALDATNRKLWKYEVDIRSYNGNVDYHYTSPPHTYMKINSVDDPEISLTGFPTGALGIILYDGKGWVLFDSIIRELDLTAGTLTGNTISLASANANPANISIIGGHAYVYDSTDLKFYVYDLAQRRYSPERDLSTALSDAPTGQTLHPFRAGVTSGATLGTYATSDGLNLYVSANLVHRHTGNFVAEYYIHLTNTSTSLGFIKYSPAADLNTPQRNPTLDVALDNIVAGNPVGATYTNATLYILGASDTHIRAWSVSEVGIATRESSKDIHLGVTGATWGSLITDGVTLWAADSVNDKLFGWDVLSGLRVAGHDLNLDTDNGHPTGMALAGQRLFVADETDTKVYGYEIIISVTRRPRETTSARYLALQEQFGIDVDNLPTDQGIELQSKVTIGSLAAGLAAVERAEWGRAVNGRLWPRGRHATRPDKVMTALNMGGGAPAVSDRRIDGTAQPSMPPKQADHPSATINDVTATSITGAKVELSSAVNVAGRRAFSFTMDGDVERARQIAEWLIGVRKSPLATLEISIDLHMETTEVAADFLWARPHTPINTILTIGTEEQSFVWIVLSRKVKLTGKRDLEGRITFTLCHPRFFHIGCVAGDSDVATVGQPCYAVRKLADL